MSVCQLSWSTLTSPMPSRLAVVVVVTVVVVFSYRGKVSLSTQLEHLGSLGQSNARQAGQIITAWEDACIAKLVEGISVGTKPHRFVQLNVLHQYAITINVHLEHYLHNTRVVVVVVKSHCWLNSTWWLGGIIVKCWTYDRVWLPVGLLSSGCYLDGWLSAALRTGKPLWNTITKINSAFYPSGLEKKYRPIWLGLMRQHTPVSSSS